MGAITSVPRSVQGLPSVQRVLDSLKSARRTNAELREVAKDALSPGRATVGIQGGAAVAGVVEAVAGQRAAPLVTWAAAVAALGTGIVMEQPDLVMVANGLMAPSTAAQAFKIATAWQRGDSPFPQSK